MPTIPSMSDLQRGGTTIEQRISSTPVNPGETFEEYWTRIMPNWDVMKQKAMGTFDPGDYYSGKSGPLGLLGKGIKAVENFATTQN